MRKKIRGWLGIEELEVKVDKIDITVKTLVDNVERQTSGFGNYKKQTDENLIKNLGKIEALISQIELLADTKSTTLEIARVKSMLQKLRNNKTRIEHARNAA